MHIQAKPATFVDELRQAAAYCGLDTFAELMKRAADEIEKLQVAANTTASIQSANEPTDPHVRARFLPTQ